ncbi:MAG: BON domain-containing protein [Burkholderiaceae bacterium]|nr:BON domain-containing protein [Burkholderiaceae bacterium]
MHRSGALLSSVAIFSTALGLSVFSVMPAFAQAVAGVPAGDEEVVVITGARSAASDGELTRRVETALDANPYLDASRITVTAREGVVHLEGLVGDTGDLLDAIRTAGRVPGTRRIVEELDTYEPDGYGN